jgi:hypothetical protein
MTKHKHYDIAYRAFYNTSFSPDKRAEMYCNYFDENIQTLKDAGASDKALEKYESLWLKWMGAKSRCMSSMITGPANFPVRRAEKANNAEHNASTACSDYYNKVLNAIEKEQYYKDHPEARPVMSGDSDALERLQSKLDNAKALQERMKTINKAHRAFLKNPDSLDKSDLSEDDKKLVREYKPAYSWEPHPFAPFQLSNNNANIKRIEGRIKQLSARKEQGDKEIEVNGVKIVQNSEAMRLQVFFDGKPEREIIQLMKSNAFKWAPSVGAWQRQLTNNAIYSFNHYVLPELKKLEV